MLVVKRPGSPLHIAPAFITTILCCRRWILSADRRSTDIFPFIRNIVQNAALSKATNRSWKWISLFTGKIICVFQGMNLLESQRSQMTPTSVTALYAWLCIEKEDSKRRSLCPTPGCWIRQTKVNRQFNCFNRSIAAETNCFPYTLPYSVSLCLIHSISSRGLPRGHRVAAFPYPRSIFHSVINLRSTFITSFPGYLRCPGLCMSELPLNSLRFLKIAFYNGVSPSHGTAIEEIRLTRQNLPSRFTNENLSHEKNSIHATNHFEYCVSC